MYNLNINPRLISAMTKSLPVTKEDSSEAR